MPPKNARSPSPSTQRPLVATPAKDARARSNVPSDSHERNSYSVFSIGVTGLFSLMSIAMVLANKCVVAIQPEDGAKMLLVQVAFTALVMASYAFMYKPSAFHQRQLQSWAPCAVLFTCNIVTSAMALEYITVPTFSVLRNVQPFISTVLGLYLLPLLNPSVPSEPTSYFKLYALLLILIGTGIYYWKDIAFDLNGYLWVLGHILSMSLYIALVKSMGSGKDALPSSTMSL
jgi:drug/metabolite transporter (DMT)-like permease